MTKITLRKIVTSLIGSIMPLAMFAGQDNVAPQAKVSTELCLNGAAKVA